VRRWIAAIGRTRLAAFFRLASARWAARRASDGAGGVGGAGASPAPSERAVRALYRRCVQASLREPVDLRDLAVDGDDLRQAGVLPGPELGRMLSRLLDQVLEDPSLNTRDKLMALARAASHP
jgi:tRNA nucleotidyltransferase (CCA-adding enzyme)